MNRLLSYQLLLSIAAIHLLSACSPINSLTLFDQTQAAILIEHMKIQTKSTPYVHHDSLRYHPNATYGTNGAR